ncbi:hypothetical protein NL676_015392 [Syzygium grande]|nr:hypothetical protein NL676_015392 [Syzygium grande]
MPWKGKGYQVAVEEFELVLAPSVDNYTSDAVGSQDPTELRLRPTTVKWLLFSWGTFVNLGKERECGMQHKSADNVHFSSASGSPSPATGSREVATNKASPLYGGYSVELSSSLGQGTGSDLHLLNVITGWVPFVADKEEGDFGARLDIFTIALFMLCLWPAGVD